MTYSTGGGAMVTGTNRDFDPKAFLASVGKGRSIIKARQGDIIFSQGDPADALFYLQNGKVKVTTPSTRVQNGPTERMRNP
jgi:CRP-like cAMP-binding protein